MRHGSLFSGIGGFDLAAEWMGWENVFQVEWDSYCQKVLAKNFPNTKRYGDIREFDGTQYKGTIDIISGGFPCQPFSHAGRRKGKSDDRYLWPEMLRVIDEAKPPFVVGENVDGLVSMANGKVLDGILSDLAIRGYQTEQFIIPASAVMAIHRRDRIWIIAYTTSDAIPRQIRETSKNNGRKITSDDKKIRGQFQTIQYDKLDAVQETYSDTYINRLEGNSSKPQTSGYINRFREANDWRDYSFESAICRTSDGIPNRVDRIKGLGNAIVPQVAYEIFKAIEFVNNSFPE